MSSGCKLECFAELQTWYCFQGSMSSQTKQGLMFRRLLLACRASGVVSQVVPHLSLGMSGGSRVWIYWFSRVAGQENLAAKGAHSYYSWRYRDGFSSDLLKLASSHCICVAQAGCPPSRGTIAIVPPSNSHPQAIWQLWWRMSRVSRNGCCGVFRSDHRSLLLRNSQFALEIVVAGTGDSYGTPLSKVLVGLAWWINPKLEA